MSKAACETQEHGRKEGSMKELVEVIAKALVDHPDEIVVTEKVDGRNVVVELHVASSVGGGDHAYL